MTRGTDDYTRLMGTGTLTSGWRHWLAIGFVAYPWLHARASGPWVTVEPALVALAGVIGLLAIASRFPPNSMPRGIVVTAIGTVAVLLVADGVARSDVMATPAVAFTCLAVAAIATCAAVVHAGQRDEWAAVCAWGWLVAALASTLIALAQHWGIESAFGNWASPSPMHHAFANLRQRNHFATLACIGLASVGWLGTRSRSRVAGAALACAAVLLSVGLAASASRTGMIEVLVLMLLWLSWRDRSFRRWAVFLGAGYAVAGVLLLAASGGHGVLHRLWGDAPDCQGRQVLWTTVVGLISEQPWTGWGWDAFPLAVYRSQANPHFCALVENAHNLPLHLAFALGVPLALAACGVLGWVILRLRPWSAASAARQLGMPVLALLLVHSLLEYPLWYAPFQMALGLGVGLVWTGNSTWRVPRAALAALASAWFVLGAYVTFDYARVTQPFLPIETRWRWSQDSLADAQRSWLFRDLARYAQLTSLPVTPQTAARIHALSGEVMSFAPHPAVIERRIASARLLGLESQADEERRRYLRTYSAPAP